MSSFVMCLENKPYLPGIVEFIGTGYIISLAVVAEVYYLSEHLESFWLEDVFITGICAGKLSLQLIPRADMGVRSPNGCKAKSVITGHEIEWYDMYIIHSYVVNGSEYCFPKWKSLDD